MTVTTFNEKIPNFIRHLKRYWSITKTNNICKRILKTTLNAVYRRNTNLQNIFVKVAITEAILKNDSLNFSAKIGNTKKCSWCKSLVETATFKK